MAPVANLTVSVAWARAIATTMRTVRGTWCVEATTALENTLQLQMTAAPWLKSSTNFRSLMG